MRMMVQNFFNSFIALVVLVVVVFTFSLKGVAMLEYG